MTTIKTIIGDRERYSLGETTVPTYYGRLHDGDTITLQQLGYRNTDTAVGIREDGKLVHLAANGYYWESYPPADLTADRINRIRQGNA